MSESPLEDAAEAQELDDAEDPDVPDLSGEADNDPAEGVEYAEVETQDSEDTVTPEQNKHEE